MPTKPWLISWGKDIENRDFYLNLAKEMLGNIVQAEVERLIDGASPGRQTITERLHNPTGVHFRLEGQTVLRLQFLARKTVAAERRENWFYASAKWAMAGFCVGGLGGLLFFPPLFWFDSAWGYIWANTALVVLMMFGVIGLVSVFLCFACETSLRREASACQDDPGFEKEFQLWKRH